jgi:molybdate transport system substrate-binding protein
MEEDPAKEAPVRNLLLILLALLISLTCAGQQITIAAASDLQYAFKDLSAEFSRQTGIAVQVTYGSSGILSMQIQNGAPFDLFFSADAQYPKALLEGGYAEPGSLYAYATGRLAVWVPNDSKLDLRNGLQALSAPGIRKIAIANPQHAPYGRAAVAAMRSSGVYEQVKDKLVLGENVSQTAQFVATGNADIGLIALSLALSPSMSSQGSFVEVPGTAYPPIEQAAVIVKASAHKSEAARFLQYLKSEAGVALMKKFGFAPPR